MGRRDDVCKRRVLQAVRAEVTEARTHHIAYVHSRGSSHRTTLYSVLSCFVVRDRNARSVFLSLSFVASHLVW